MLKKLNLFLSLILFLNGCATITGPVVSQQEIIEFEEELKVKALEYRLKQLEHVNNIGYRLIYAILPSDTKKPFEPFLGVYVFDINKYLKRLYNLSQDKGVVVGLVIDGSPAKKAGLLKGDIILSINLKRINSSFDFYNEVKKFKIGQIVNINILRQGIKETIFLEVGSVALNIPINMVDLQEVNAAASSQGIFVTYGLMHFVKSDDELAAVLAHELAHIMREHIQKFEGVSLITFLLSLPLSILLESQAPGSGQVVTDIGNIFKATYSRDLEREADYFGTRLVYQAGFDVEVCATFMERFAIEIPQSMIRNYLSTHPSSPERVLRIKKTIQELKSSTQSNFRR